MIQTYEITSDKLAGTHREIREFARIMGCLHFGECIIHYDDFEISVDYEEVEKDGTFSTSTRIVIYYDEDEGDDEYGSDVADEDPNPSLSPAEAANVDPLSDYPFLTLTAVFIPTT